MTDDELLHQLRAANGGALTDDMADATITADAALIVLAAAESALLARTDETGTMTDLDRLTTAAIEVLADAYSITATTLRTWAEAGD